MKCFEREVAWLRALCEHYPTEIEGDGLATTLQSAGVVLLMAAGLQTESAILISRLTGSPEGFVRPIVTRVDRNRFRHSEQFNDLDNHPAGFARLEGDPSISRLGAGDILDD